jgi:hypothetical protein
MAIVYSPISQSLHSNGYTCYTAPSLRLFIPIFFSKGCACDVCAWSHLPPRGSVFMVFTLQLLPLLPPYGCSFWAPCQRVSWSRFFTIMLLQSVETKIPRVAGVPTYPALTLCAVSSFILEGANPSTMSWHSFSESWSSKQTYTNNCSQPQSDIFHWLTNNARWPI